VKHACLLVAIALAVSVAQTAHAQITEATWPTNDSATRKNDTSPEAQARRARSSNQPGPFGVGAEIGVNPGGIEPSVLYDFNKSFPLRGMVDVRSGHSAVAGAASVPVRSQRSTPAREANALCRRRPDSRHR
jgi:hypothetical protein